MEKTWKMNETQMNFVADLKGMGGAATLLDLKLAGRNYKTGSINTLVSKKVVEIVGEKDYECEVVFNGVAVGKITKTGKIYKLVNND